MIKKILLLFTVIVGIAACAQTSNAIINAKEAERIENTLASDDMKGRKAGTPDIDRAAGFIAAEFRKAGLQPVQGNNFLQSFSMVRPKLISAEAEINGQEIDGKNMVVITTGPEIKIDEKSGYEIQHITAGESLTTK